MYITKLHIEGFGNITSETFSLNEQTSVIKTDFCDEIVAALKLILGYNNNVHYFRKSTIIKAECVTDSLISVEYSGGELNAYNKEEEYITEDYLNIMSHNSEEDSLNVFQHFKNQKYPHRLLKYKDIDRYYGEHDFRKITDGYGVTRSFRAFLNEYIKTFTPIKINQDKEYFIHLLPSGEFVVKYKDEPITLYEEIEVNGNKFFLSHTVPSKKRMQNFYSLLWQEFIIGEPEYEKEYFPDKYIVTGHTPTGFIDTEYKGKIWSKNHHIAIDCGAVFGNPLGCICLDNLQKFYVE